MAASQLRCRARPRLAFSRRFPLRVSFVFRSYLPATLQLYKHCTFQRRSSTQAPEPPAGRPGTRHSMPPHTSLLPQLGGLHATRPCVCPRINRLGDIPYPAHTPCPHDACAARPDTPACCYTAHSPPRATQISLRTHNMAKISVTAGRVLFFLASSPTVTATAFHTPALLAPSISPLVLGLQSCPPGNPEPPQVPQGANTGPPARFTLFIPSRVRPRVFSLQSSVFSLQSSESRFCGHGPTVVLL